MKQIINSFFYFLLVFFQIFSSAESKTVGVPFINNYSHKVYGQHEQNWAIAQNNQGIMYFGNSHGLLEYDGTNWKIIQTPSPYIVRSLTITAQNKIFLGGFNYFGYLAKDSTENLYFNSLSDNLDPHYKSFGNVWNTYVADNSIYFQTDSALFRWDNKNIKIWETTYPMNRSFSIRDTIYLVLKNQGLMRMNGDSLQLMPGGELFAQEKIFSMIAMGVNEILISTRNLGFFIYSNNSIKPFPTEIDEFCTEYNLTAATTLQDGSIVIATRQNGMAVIDRMGRLLQFIDKNKGLPGNTIWNLFSDNQGGLWLALNNGISRIELPAPLTYFNESAGIEGTVESIVRHKGVLYVATPTGLYFFDPEKSSSLAEKIPSFNPYKLLSTGKHLIASGYNGGTHVLQNNKMRRISDYQGNCFRQSKKDQNRIYIGDDTGIASVYFRNGQWFDEDYIDLDSSPIRDIIETRNGDLWLGTHGGMIIKIVIAADTFSFEKAKIFYFNEQNGLSYAEQNHVFSFDGQVLIGNGNRMLKYDEASNRFIVHETFRGLFADTTRVVTELAADAQNNLYMFSAARIGLQLGVALQKENGNYLWDMIPFMSLVDYSFYSVYPDPESENIIWFGGPDGLFRYDNAVVKNYIIDFSCPVRRVSTLGDSVIYAGNPDINRSDGIASLAYQYNALRFIFTSPFYQNERANRYQYFLEGFDKKWSEWNHETKATYTNIPEGRYLFRVRAKNIYNVISKETNYAFKILPPWYRTWWAYGIYGIIIFGMVLGLLKLRSLKLEYEKKELEKIIGERTDEIQIKNKQLEEQAGKLQEMDEIKSRFFTNISHEFRTPLTLIKGPAEQMLNKSYSGKPEKAFNLILRNANRLLQLINQLLDLSKLESGTVELRTALLPLSSFISVVINSFSSLAESRKIHLQYIKPQEEIEIYFDRDKLEKILYNILSNAFKFTPENCYITVALHKIKTNSYPQGAVEISVHDSGVGIPENELKQIFDRFTQGHNSSNNHFEGSGIGLALTKELVELHHGKITVASNAEEGTEFDVILPMGKDHLKPEEIIEKIQIIDKTDPDLKFDLDEIHDEVEMQQKNRQQRITSEKNIVLIIEDNRDVRKYIKEHLEKDFEIIEAENGKAGLKLANEQLPDLIVSDVMMPEMDGYELTDTLKKGSLTSHIPVILLTAKTSDEAKIEGLETGADAYMAKPFNAKELEVRVKKLIESRNNLREKFKKEFLLEPTDVNSISMDDDFIKRVHDTIEEKMANPEFNVEVLLDDFALGQRQFTRKVIALTGQTPVQFIRIMRLKRAMTLIRQGAGSLSQIAFDVGFRNLSYFSKCFRLQFGKLPSEVM